MKWLFWQTWVLLLLSFLVGAFITWMVFVKPRRRVSVLAMDPNSAAVRPVAELVGAVVGSSNSSLAGQAPGADLSLAAVRSDTLSSDTPDLDTPVLGIPVAHRPAAADPAPGATAAATKVDDNGFGGNSDDTLVLAADVAAGRTPQADPAGTGTPTSPADTDAPADPAGPSTRTDQAEAASSATVDSEAEPPYGPGSVEAPPDGAAPSPEYQIKGNRHSMLYHTPDSPYYSRTRPGVWFRTEDDARRAGFHPWNRRARQDAKLPAQSVRGGA